jgi:hypothetical protein
MRHDFLVNKYSLFGENEDDLLKKMLFGDLLLASSFFGALVSRKLKSAQLLF